MLYFDMRFGAAAPNKGPAYWIFIPAVVVSVGWFLVALHSEMQSFQSILPICILTVAVVGMGLQWAGQRVAASVCAVLVLACYWFPMLLFVFVVMLEGRAGVLLFFAYYAVIIIPVGLFAVPATLSFSDRAGIGWVAGAVILAIIPCVIISGSGAAKERARYSRGPRAADPSVLADDFLAIDKCIQQYAAANPKEGYPQSLSQLGPEGTLCLPRDVVQGEKQQFTIHYHPGARGANGTVSNYQVQALETRPQSKERSTIYSSESGLIWMRYDMPGTNGPPYLLFYPGSDFNGVENCMWNAGDLKLYTSEGIKTTADRDEYLARCLWGGPTNERDRWVHERYRYEYRLVTGSNGRVDSFEVSVRPVQYGVSALRSYLAEGLYTDEGDPKSLSVYATVKDRPATERDPLALPVEVALPLLLPSAKLEWCGSKLCE